jgi:hypothetical protein
MTALGALGPSLLLLLASGAVSRFEEATTKIGLTFLVVCLIVVALFATCVVIAGRDDEFLSYKYTERGFTYTCSLFFGSASVIEIFKYV